MSDVDDTDDLELLRQAALTSLLKKKAEATTTNAVFYRPSANSNLISIQPVIADTNSDANEQDNGENNCSTDSENEIIIAEGLSVSSSDCDEIVEEVVMSEEEENEDENNDVEQKEEEGEDAVSLASKDSFDEILNSIEEEISGGVKAASRIDTTKPKKKSEKDDERVRPNRGPARSPERNFKKRSRSPIYYRSSGGGNRRNTSRPRNQISRSRSPIRRRSRSRSPIRPNHSSNRIDNVRRPRTRSPFDRSDNRYSSSRRPENKPLVNGRRRRSRSPPIENRGRSRRDEKHRSQSPSNSRLRIPSVSKSRSRSSSKTRRTERPLKSPPAVDKEDRTSGKAEQKEKSPTPPDNWQHLTQEERERLEKRKRKFQSSNVNVSSGKIVLKSAKEENREKEMSQKGAPVITRTVEDDLPSDEGYSDRKEDKLSKERLERKLKLSSRLGVKVSEPNPQQQANFEVEADESSLSPHQELTGRLVESLESFEPSTSSIPKEDLRSKLEEKRASGGGRLFSFALRDTFVSRPSSRDKKSRRKAVR